MNILRQSTAVDVLIGPFVDSTDGDSEETTLTISAADVLLSKNGQAMGAKNAAAACAHDAGGMYNCELDATDTNTVGTLVLFVHESGALAVRHEFQVVEEAVYDAMFASGAGGPTTASDLPTNFADLAITASTGRVTVGTNNDKTGYSISGTLTTLDALDTAQDTQHSTTQSAITALNDLSAADVNAEVDTALADIHLDHLLAVDYDPASKPGAATALLNEMVESDGGVTRFTANALEEAPSSGGGGNATEANQTIIINHLTDIKGATWATTDSLEAIRDRGDSAWATATGFSTHSAADVWSAGTRTLTAATNITSTGVAVPIDANGYVESSTYGVQDSAFTASFMDVTHGPLLPCYSAGFDGANLRQPLGLASANIDTQLAALQTDLDTITDTGVTVVALTSAAITDVWSTDTLPESYAADGTAATPAQAMYLIQQALTEASITGTTMTIKQLDGSTTAATLTLDDAVNPTSKTRAT